MLRRWIIKDIVDIIDDAKYIVSESMCYKYDDMIISDKLSIDDLAKMVNIYPEDLFNDCIEDLYSYDAIERDGRVFFMV